MEEKRQCIDPAYPGLSIQQQCELVGLSRASYYRSAPVGVETAENLALMRLLDEEYTRHPFYGSRKMSSWLRRQGYAVNRKRIQRLMRKMGLVSVAPKPGSSRSAPAHKVYPYLLRGLDIGQPDHVWCADITYIRMANGFVYLTAVMDWFTRYVLAWEVSVTMEDGFCVSALESALRRYRCYCTQHQSHRDNYQQLYRYDRRWKRRCIQSPPSRQRGVPLYHWAAQRSHHSGRRPVKHDLYRPGADN